MKVIQERLQKNATLRTRTVIDQTVLTDFITVSIPSIQQLLGIKDDTEEFRSQMNSFYSNMKLNNLLEEKKAMEEKMKELDKEILELQHVQRLEHLPNFNIPEEITEQNASDKGEEQVVIQISEDVQIIEVYFIFFFTCRPLALRKDPTERTFLLRNARRKKILLRIQRSLLSLQDNEYSRK